MSPFLRYDSPLSRRAAVGVGIAGAASTVKQANAAETWQPDFQSPKDNLKAFVKLTSRLDGKPIVGWYGGVVFGVVGDTDILKPLFGLEGFGTGICEPLPNGTYKSSWKEVGFYKDLKTDKIIERWDNPYIGETVETLHIQNEAAVNGILADHYPDVTKFAPLGEPGSLMMEFPNYQRYDDPTRPFVLPWSVVGDTVSVWNDVRARVKNVLDPAVYVRESTGTHIRVMESFQYIGSMKELTDDGLQSANYTGAWNRIAPWLPWMLMGQKPGHMFYRCTTKKLEKFEQLPKSILNYTEKNFAKYLDYNTPWRLPNESSYEVYKKLRKPMPPRAA
jgi:Protein of unknown function (DUF1838)